MFLLINKTTKQIMVSSARPLALEQYGDDATKYEQVEIPDDQYTPDMVGGILNDDGE